MGLFLILFGIGIVGIIVGYILWTYWAVYGGAKKVVAGIVAALSSMCLAASFATPYVQNSLSGISVDLNTKAGTIIESSEAKIQDFMNGNWLIMDIDGDQISRHWILENKRAVSVVSAERICFYDQHSNHLCVAGDSLSVEIAQPMSEFLVDYRGRFGIPTNQKALR
ncbi:hypothetical protein ACFL2R_04400 [Patescibacteria group bacterium]